jgi:hypothetical protein
MIRDAAQRHGISLSICNWVRRELMQDANWVSTVARDTGSKANGYACLGYYVRFFGDNEAEPALCNAAQ